MRVEYGFIAEAADTVNGLFYVVRGGTDIWNLPMEAEFPLAVGPMSFVIRLIGEPHEVGSSIGVEFQVVDADGQSIGMAGAGQIEFTPHPIDRTRASGALLHFRMAVSVPAPGAYFFELHSGGIRLTQVPFWIMTVEMPAAT